MDEYMRFIVVHAFGAVIGWAASRARGFSAVLGAAIGFFLGPAFAWIPFLVNGIIQAREMTRCPHCREWILSRATVCRYCGRDVDPRPPQTPGSLRLVISRRACPQRVAQTRRA